MLTGEIKESIKESVLCWLATCSDGLPNVSPKELFDFVDPDKVIIVQLMSPNSENNIRQNPNVSVSLIHVFKQYGWQLKGKAKLIKQGDENFETYFKKLNLLAQDLYPIKKIIEVTVNETRSIKAPSYAFYPKQTEAQKIKSALKTYQVETYLS